MNIFKLCSSLNYLLPITLIGILSVKISMDTMTSVYSISIGSDAVQVKMANISPIAVKFTDNNKYYNDYKF